MHDFALDLPSHLTVGCDVVDAGGSAFWVQPCRSAKWFSGTTSIDLRYAGCCRPHVRTCMQQFVTRPPLTMSGVTLSAVHGYIGRGVGAARPRRVHEHMRRERTRSG